jgi:CBS domain-containing protein
MIVGNVFNHGLYHALIPVLSLPFLNSEPADVMWLVNVVDVMTKDVVALSRTCSRHSVLDIIRKCDSGELSHHAFPVVDCHMKQRRLRGIISLENLRLAAKGHNTVQGANGRMRRFSLTGQGDQINLLDFADRSPITTVPHAKVARAFELFRKMGMRHLCVCDIDGILVGMITRKNLMTFELADNIRLHKAEAMLRGWVNRWRAARKRRHKQEEAAVAAATLCMRKIPHGCTSSKLPPALKNTSNLLPHSKVNGISRLPPIILPEIARAQSTELDKIGNDALP